MKRFVLSLLLLGVAFLPAPAQQPHTRDFASVTDSLRVRLQRRTGVNSYFKLEKLLVRGNTLDFYYSQNLSAIPWRQEDVSWFQEQLAQLGEKALNGYSIGHVFANKQELSELPTPLLGNDGKPLSTSLRVSDQ